MKNTSLSLQLWLRSWPWEVWVTAALITAALALWGAMVPDAYRRAANEEALVARLKAPRSSRLQLLPSAEGATDGLQVFDKALATEQVRADLLEQVWARAAMLDVKLTKVEFQRQAVPNGRYMRLQMILPVSGGYASIRRFVFALMEQFPSLSLDKLDLKRESPNQATLDAVVHMSLLERP